MNKTDEICCRKSSKWLKNSLLGTCQTLQQAQGYVLYLYLLYSLLMDALLDLKIET